jgi:CheY-like chemotaxis protein
MALQALDAVARAISAGRMFDAVLMDVQMPGMSGYEATRHLRERHPSPRLPIIALTAAALTSERERAEAVGMDAFLTKPIDRTAAARHAAATAVGRRGRLTRAARISRA